jgi:DNA-binding CsgD family transcriptional regulator
VLYLENSLLRGVFDQSRVDLSRSAGAQLKLLLENRLLKKLLENKEDQPENKSTESLSEKLRNEYSLTPGEARIALLLKEGVHRDELCARLNITSNTFKNHMRAIYNKTINLRDDHYASTGRIDKLSSLILFLMKLEGR